MERNQPGKYDDIIHLPRPVSGRRAHMSMVDRGAQFSPFAALVGYEAVLEERARLTEAETCLEADVKEELSRALGYLSNHLEETGEIRIRCFQRELCVAQREGQETRPVCRSPFTGRWQEDSAGGHSRHQRIGVGTQ